MLKTNKEEGKMATIYLSKEFKEILDDMKQEGDTYNDVIARLIYRSL